MHTPPAARTTSYTWSARCARQPRRSGRRQVARRGRGTQADGPSCGPGPCATSRHQSTQPPSPLTRPAMRERSRPHGDGPHRHQPPKPPRQTQPRLEGRPTACLRRLKHRAPSACWYGQSSAEGTAPPLTQHRKIASTNTTFGGQNRPLLVNLLTKKFLKKSRSGVGSRPFQTLCIIVSHPGFRGVCFG